MDFSGNIVLTPVASVEDANKCSVTMKVFIDPIHYLDGTLIQIEYLIYDLSYSSSGFITYEPGWEQSGINNQLIIGIPCTEAPTDYSGDTEVKVRAYFGKLSASAISVTDWSNSQSFYNPPEQPEIKNAYYSNGTIVYPTPTDDAIHLLIEPNPNYFYEGIIDTPHLAVKFMVSYNYTDICGNVEWKVSELESGDVVIYEYRPYISVNVEPLYGFDIDVSDAVNVAVNAVYEFSTTYNVSYYSVSQISETKQAVPLLPNAPELEPIEYNIYNANPNFDTTSYQKMVLNWTLPDSSIFLDLTSFSILSSINGGSWTVVASVLSPLERSFIYQVPSSYLTTPNPNNFNFQVVANYSNQSYASNSEFSNTFTFATEPQQLTCRYAIPNENMNTTDIAFSFKNPLNVGQGEGYKFVYDIKVGLTTIYSHYVDYDSTNTGFYYVFKTIDTQSNGTINVRLETKNTNNDPLKPYVGGAVKSASYIVVGVPIVESIGIVGGNLVVKISSGDILGILNKIIYINTATSLLTEKSFDTPLPSDNYTVFESIESGTDIITYTYTFAPAYFSPLGIPSNLIVCASNEAGIGSGIYPSS